MKHIVLRIAIVFLTLFAFVPVSGEAVRENPSLYSYAEIVQKLPSMWIANPIEVLEMMKQYLDYQCYRSLDMIGCVSVNNRYAGEVHVNYQFSSEDDYAEFVGATFTMEVNSSADIQRIIELFWLPDMKAAKIWDSEHPENQIRLYFSNDTTLATYTIYQEESGQPWLVMVEMGLIRG